MRRKGIILAGGKGTRLFPATHTVCKQLLPVYDKPMIYYPLATLMLAGIREILIISSPRDLPNFETLLGDGYNYGLKIDYKVQPDPNGIAEALILGEEFLANDPSALILGDNIFYGHDLSAVLKKADTSEHGATIFAYHVTDPERYGVVDFDENNKVRSLEEKPMRPATNFAVTGLYFYDNNASHYAKELKPSRRAELEITDLNQLYLDDDDLGVELLGRGFAWLDTGTHDSLLDASQYVATIERRQGLKVACLEEIAFRQGWISADQLLRLAKKYAINTSYRNYLENLL